jgi:hypothetical protein
MESPEILIVNEKIRFRICIAGRKEAKQYLNSLNIRGLKA